MPPEALQFHDPAAPEVIVAVNVAVQFKGTVILLPTAVPVPADMVNVEAWAFTSIVANRKIAKR